MFKSTGVLPLLLSLFVLGCSEQTGREAEEPSPLPGRPNDAGRPGDANVGPSPSQRGDGGALTEPDPSQSCAAVSNKVELLPVHLAFAFDVSGSMGKGDEAWHSKELKWDPVVKATRAFFDSDESAGLFASLTFFPARSSGESGRCKLAAYTTPSVPATLLPSAAFGAAISGIEQEIEEDGWRGGTPTAWVVRGTLAYIEQQKSAAPGKHAIVLVTDGEPDGCSNADDKVATVATEVEGAAALGIPTYVIGVRNPMVEGAPANVEKLGEIAVAGGTEAVLLDTGDPAATAAALQAAISEIRDASISCDAAIPQPSDGRPFDKTKVAFRYVSGAKSQTFEHDQSCTKPGAWRYDDTEQPTQIELCPATCNLVQADPKAELEISFQCEQVVFI